jgi:hypothetical protein
MGQLNYIHPGQSPSVPLNLVAGSALANNDLAVIDQAGRVKKFNSRLSVAQTHLSGLAAAPANAVLTTFAPSNGASSTAGYVHHLVRVGDSLLGVWKNGSTDIRYQWLDLLHSPVGVNAELVNGDFLIANVLSSGDNAAVVTVQGISLLVRCYSPSGQNGAALTLSTDVGNSASYVNAKLMNNGHISVAWVSNVAGRTLKLAVVDPATGLQVGATVTVTSTLAIVAASAVALEGRVFDLEIFPTGEIGMVWCVTTSLIINCAVYSAALVQIGATQTLYNASSGVWAGYRRIAKLGTDKLFFAVARTTGTTVEGYVIHNDGSTSHPLSVNIGSARSVMVARLSDGTVAAGYYNTTLTQHHIALIQTDGTLSATVRVSTFGTPVISGSNYDTVYIVPMRNKFLAMIPIAANDGAMAYAFSNAGVQRNAGTALGAAIGTATDCKWMNSVVDGSNALISWCPNNAGPSNIHITTSITEDGVLNYSYNNGNAAGGSQDIATPPGMVVVAGVLHVLHSNAYAGAITSRRLLVEQASIAGVVSGAAGIGDTAKLLTVGAYAVNQTVIGGAFNQQAATPSGNKGFAGGNSVVLRGVA